MTRALEDPGFAAFGDTPATLPKPTPKPTLPRATPVSEMPRMRDVVRKYGPHPPFKPRASALKLGLFAFGNFVLVFALCLGIWAMVLTGGVSAADFGAIGREIIGAISFKLSHLTTPTPTLPPRA